MLNARVLIAGVLASLLTACASYGPVGTPEFEVTLRKDVPSFSGILLYRGRATIFYGVDGYSLIDDFIDRWSAPRKGWYKAGAIALSEEKLYFVSWIGDKYEIYWDVDLKKIVSVEVRALLQSHRLVIKFDEDPKVTSFGIISEPVGNQSGPFYPLGPAATVCQLIAERSGRQCELPK